MFRGERRFGFACARAYGSEVIAFGDGFIPGTKVPALPGGTLRLFLFCDFVLSEVRAVGGWSGIIPCLCDTWAPTVRRGRRPPMLFLQERIVGCCRHVWDHGEIRRAARNSVSEMELLRRA